ncbi:MAG: sugar nucleotide-binding protein, partial [Candidatus Eremiobacteraeota bacterium]|nr:sugar nucleotide-binding protein [Candidatus Eremiobacteraeota bacterium]
EALRQAGIDAPLDAISSGEWKAGARRPRYSALENARLRELGIAMPDWRAGIAAYLADKASRSQ